MKKIGLTGGIGSGKTTIAKAFELLGAPVYYADVRSKELTVSNPNVVKELKKILGNDVYFANGSLNKRLMSEKIFSDKTLLRSVEAVIHPAVYQDFELWAEAQSKKGARYALMEAALIIETRQTHLFDELWVATAPEEMRICRTMLRDHCSRESVLARMACQTSDTERFAVAKHLFVTDDQHSLLPFIIDLHNQL